MSRGVALGVAAALVIALSASLARPVTAQAFSVGGAFCGIGGLISGVIGKGCDLATHAGRLLNAGQKLLGGHLGQAVNALSGASPTIRRATSIAGLAAIAASVFTGTRFGLHAVAGLISATTEPQLGSDWFGGAYWRMAGIAVLLTVPLLLAAVGQAIVRSDLGLLGRTAFGFLPLSGVAIGIAIPLTVLLLRGSDEMTALVAHGMGAGPVIGAWVLTGVAGVSVLLSHSVFLAFLLGLIACLMTIALWIELAIRQAAVTVIVLMLPLFFAALVWPARRVWAARALELLVSLILAKFVIVAVLSLGTVALTHALLPGAASAITGVTLIMLAALSPWALLRILPLHELAGAAASSLRPSAGSLAQQARTAEGADEAAHARRTQEEAAAPGGAEGLEQLVGSGAPQLLTRFAATGGSDESDGPDGSAPGGGAPQTPDGDEAVAANPGTGWSPTSWKDGLPPRPRPGSDVDPRITQAPDFDWPTLELGPGGLADDRPLYEPSHDPPQTPDPPEPPADPAGDESSPE